MITLLKFGASWLLPPGIFILLLALLVLYAYLKKQKKIASLLLAIVLFLYLSSISIVSSFLIAQLENSYNPPKIIEKVDAIVVLGGGATNDTPDITGVGGLNSIPSARLLTALRLQKKLDSYIILSGGQIYDDSGKEADIAKRILMDLGVKEDKIILENNSLTTTENAKYTAKIIKDKGFKDVILVTSAFHMNRAMENFHQEGISPIAYPGDYMVNKKLSVHLTKFMPSSQALEMTSIFFQEKLRYFITKYLGK